MPPDRGKGLAEVAMPARPLVLWLLLSAAAWPVDLLVEDAAEMARVVDASEPLVTLHSGFRYTEGPVWTPDDGGVLVFSDLGAGEQWRWTAAGGAELLVPQIGKTNGHTRDLAGRLLSCEERGRRVTRLEEDGTITTVVDRWDGKRFDSPNDIVVTRDGRIWFTDPPWGLGGRNSEVPGNYVYRVEPDGGGVVPVVTDLIRPNGLCFSPDESVLYVAESEPNAVHALHAYPVDARGNVGAGRRFALIDDDRPDGIRCDRDGRVWSTAGDGVHIFKPDGTRIGKILTPKKPANLAFGGARGTTLFLTHRDSLLKLEVLVTGSGSSGSGGASTRGIRLQVRTGGSSAAIETEISPPDATATIDGSRIHIYSGLDPTVDYTISLAAVAVATR